MYMYIYYPSVSHHACTCTCIPHIPHNHYTEWFTCTCTCTSHNHYTERFTCTCTCTSHNHYTERFTCTCTCTSHNHYTEWFRVTCTCFMHMVITRKMMPTRLLATDGARSLFYSSFIKPLANPTHTHTHTHTHTLEIILHHTVPLFFSSNNTSKGFVDP